MHELEVLQNQFKQMPNQFPGMSCGILGWHETIAQPRADCRGIQDNQLILPEEYLYNENTIICLWNHIARYADIPDEILKSEDESTIDFNRQEEEWICSWNKETWLVRPEWENWNKASAVHILSNLAIRSTKYLSKYFGQSTQYIDMLVEYDVFNEEMHVQPEYPELIDNFEIIKWLWCLFLYKKDQTVGFCSGVGHGFSNLKSLSSLKRNWLHYFMKSGDVFLESAFLISEMIAKVKSQTGYKKWSLPLDFIGAKEIEHGFHVPRSTLQVWDEKDLPKTTFDPTTHEKYYPRKWFETKFKDYKPRKKKRKS